MKARTLKIGDAVCVYADGAYEGKGEIISINGKAKDFHFSGDELNVDVEIRIDIVGDDSTSEVGEFVHVNNQDVYQVVDGETYSGEIVCYDNDDESDYEYFCPAQGIVFDKDDLDDGVKRYCSGYDYVQHQIESGRWDLDSDTFDLEEALADAFDEGFAQGRGS